MTSTRLRWLGVLVALGACREPAPPADTVRPEDDSAAPLEWTSLSPDVGWFSSDRGVSTGAAPIDLDGDGWRDVVAADGNDIEPGPLRVYRNVEGRLSLDPVWTSEARAYHAHVAVGDLDGDGDEDVVVSRYLGAGGWGDPGGVDVYRNDGGMLSPAWSRDGLFSFSCALGDVDRDGDLDLAVAAGEGYGDVQQPTLVFENDGTGDFGAVPVWQSADAVSLDVGWVDLDGDGWLDLAAARLGAPHAVWYGDGAGHLAATPGWTAAGASFEGNTLDWGDVDGDGAIDLAISDNDQQGGPGVVRLFCGPALDACWTSEGPDMWSAVSLEDVDGDGRADLTAGTWWGDVRIWLAAAGTPLPAEPSWRSDRADLVVEAFAWVDLDRSHEAVIRVEGEGLVEVPRGGVVSVESGVLGDGWLSGPGRVAAEVRGPAPRDLVVTDWTRGASNVAFLRE